MSDNWVEVIGRACRLPGANSVSEFWDLLVSNKFTIGEIGQDRFSTFRYLHPKSGQAGKTYTFRAGVLDDVWGFDPSVFPCLPARQHKWTPSCPSSHDLGQIFAVMIGGFSSSFFSI